MSVKIVEYKLRESFDGKQFFALTIHGGVEIVKSANGSSYVTIRKASLPTTFDEATCVNLIGTELKGTIEKVECEPYSYVIKDTGEEITLTHRYEYFEEVTMPTVDFTKIVSHSANGVHKAEIV